MPSNSTPLHISGIWKAGLELRDGEAEALVGGLQLADDHQDQPDRERLPGPGHDLRARRAQHEVVQPQAAGDPVGRQVSPSTSSAPRTPSTVLSRIGQTQPDTITSTFMVSPMPAAGSAPVTNAGGGIARRNSKTGSSSPRSVRLVPSRAPEPDPGHQRSASPASSRPRLGGRP
jgi:hypothetical protein